MVITDNVLQLKSLLDTLKDHPLLDKLINKIVSEELALINAFGRIHGSAANHAPQEEMFFLLSITSLLGDFVQKITEVQISGKILRQGSDEERLGCNHISGNLIAEDGHTIRIDIYNHVRANEAARELSLIFAKHNDRSNPTLIATINLPNMRITKSDSLIIKDVYEKILANQSISSDPVWINRCITTLRDLYSPDSIEQFAKDLSESLNITDD